MAEDSETNGANGASHEAEVEPQIRIVAQYIKDLSFENPNVERLLKDQSENPNLSIQVNVGARKMQDNLFESGIEFSAKAEVSSGVIYEMELVYAGLFHVENLPDEALEPFLLINCPTLVFPFLRRLVADLTREGGFPPLLLDPIDFASLYLQRQQAGQDASNDNPGDTGQA